MNHIFEQIKTERQRQIDKWGVQRHSPIEWCAILGEEVGEVNKEALEHHFVKFYGNNTLHNYRKELIQVAAVCVAMIESLEANDYEQLRK